MKKVEDVKFKEELAQVKEALPKYYMPLMNHYYPGKFTKSRVYNVMNAGVEDREILKALKKIASKTKTKQVA